MNDHCRVFFLPPADRQMKKLKKRDATRFVVVEGRIRQVEEDGWILSMRSELVKVLRNEICVGEIRDLGRAVATGSSSSGSTLPRRKSCM